MMDSSFRRRYWKFVCPIVLLLGTLLITIVYDIFSRLPMKSDVQQHPKLVKKQAIPQLWHNSKKGIVRNIPTPRPIYRLPGIFTPTREPKVIKSWCSGKKSIPIKSIQYLNDSSEFQYYNNVPHAANSQSTSIHPCQGVADILTKNENIGKLFVSSCASNFFFANSSIPSEVKITATVGAELTLYACIEASVGANASVPSWASSHAYHASHPMYSFQPDSFVGRVQPASGESLQHPWDRVYPIDFDHSVGVKVGTYTCYAGTVRIFDAGNYDLAVVLEYTNYDWNIENMTEYKYPIMKRVTSMESIVALGNSSIVFSSNLSLDGNALGRWIRGQWTPVNSVYQQNLFKTFDLCFDNFCNKIVFTGDSNGRRTAKSLHAVKGTRWCTDRNIRASKLCTCEDNDRWPYEGHGGVEGINFVVVRGLTEINASLHFANTLDLDTRVLVLGHFVNWDAAFSTMEVYQSRLTLFLDTLKARLALAPLQLMLVYRTGMYYCCNEPTPGFRLYTRKRVLMFNEYTIRILRQYFPHILIWNVYALGESRPISASATQVNKCGANHFDSLTVESDLDLLLNIICNNGVNVSNT